MAADIARVPPIGHLSRYRFVLTIVVALLLTGGMSIVSWVVAKRAQIDAERVRQTYAVKQALENTIRHLIDVQNGARGFSLSSRLAAARSRLRPTSRAMRR